MTWDRGGLDPGILGPGFIPAWQRDLKAASPGNRRGRRRPAVARLRRFDMAAGAQAA
jgi:hypothetical protein